MTIPTSQDLVRSWLWTPRPQPARTVRLICFPCLGADAPLYRGWPQHLEPWFEVSAVRLPGRGGRRTDDPIDDFDEAVGQIARALDQIADEPYALFGYSMGALLAFEVARRLRRIGAPTPRTLFVAARGTPDDPDAAVIDDDKSDARLVELLRSLGGTPDEVFASPELLAIVLPVMRADFRLLASYQYRDEAPLATPIVAISGSKDRIYPPACHEGWSTHTSGGFSHFVLPGGHDFVRTLETEVTSLLVHQIGRR